jgi:exonuclease SbcC
LEACAIDVTITGKTPVDLSIREDPGSESRKHLGAGEVVHVRATGRMRIDHSDMVIEMHSADPGALSASEKEAAARKALGALLERLGARSPEEAEERARAAEGAAASVRAAEKALAEELAGQSAADIAARAAALGPESPARPWADISAELARVTAERDARARELEDLEARLQEWRAAWGAPDALLSLLADALALERDITRRIDASAPLPAGFSDPQSFLSAYEKARDDAKTLADERARLSDRKRELEVRAPGETADELAGPLRDAEAAFETAVRRGRALERISRTADALLLESDSAVFRGMQAELDPLIQAMSLGHHARVDMEGTLPRGLADGSGRALPWELLSGGTRDTLALAVRLAMASFFLRDTDGFLMLDDPLVEMDPERQKAAARALASFAEKRQLIVFTCHPATAELLGGTPIRL